VRRGLLQISVRKNSSLGKAERPLFTALGKHHAALLSPALNERQPGIIEVPQGSYDPMPAMPPDHADGKRSAAAGAILTSRSEPWRGQRSSLNKATSQPWNRLGSD
jgi:hypothetical protein